MKKVYWVAVLLVIGFGIYFIFNNQNVEKQDVGIANPASVFCVDNGGKLEIRTDSTGGQVGFCIFSNKTECEEWAYFRGECKPLDLIEKENVETYLKTNIVTLSPVKAVLGGTWYVVSMTVDLEKNSGTVTYEDGHVQEKKNFSYTTNEKREVVGMTIN